MIDESGSLIDGHVAKLITDEELIVNKGSSDGVKRGMLVMVRDPSTESITDPVTGEDLGGIFRNKVTLEVIKVGTRVSLARRLQTGFAGVAEALARTPRHIVEEPQEWPEGVAVHDPVTIRTKTRTA